MSASSLALSDVDARHAFEDVASSLAAMCDEAIATGRIDDLDNEALGQIIASAVRLYAAKAETGEKLQPFARNATATPTEIAIACMAMLDAGAIEVFELGLWETMSNIRPARRSTVSDIQGTSE